MPPRPHVGLANYCDSHLPSTDGWYVGLTVMELVRGFPPSACWRRHLAASCWRSERRCKRVESLRE